MFIFKDTYLTKCEKRLAVMEKQAVFDSLEMETFSNLDNTLNQSPTTKIYFSYVTRIKSIKRR